MNQATTRAPHAKAPGNSRRGPADGLSGAEIALCAVICGSMAANLYYAQTLIDQIAPAVGLSRQVSGFIVMFTQLGYGLGLMLLVPLADKLANRAIIATCLFGAALALLAVTFAPGPVTFLVAICILGVLSAGAQVVVPYSAALTSEERRGRVIGKVMAGLITGILLARPAASFMADLLEWQGIFWVSAALMAAFGVMALLWLPQREPDEARSYPALLATTARLLVSRPVLQRRSLYQGLVFAAFNILWSVTPMQLSDRWHFSQIQVALFALVGAGGALSAPFAGHAADKGRLRASSYGAIALAAAMAMLCAWAGTGLGSVAVLALGAFLVDAGVQSNQVLGQKAIYAQKGASPGRLNSAYMTGMFVMGACGAGAAPALYHGLGYGGTMTVAAALAGVALVLAILEPDMVDGGVDAASRKRRNAGAR